MKIAILAGGNSTEREVSLCSGTMAYQALKGKGHQVVLVDVYLGVTDVDVKTVFTCDRDWAAGVSAIGEKNPDLNDIRKMKNGDTVFFGPNVLEICKAADIVFMALHGANGEDGKIQAALDLYDIKYTGTDYMSSALCMDKAITKVFFEYHNIVTPKSIVVKKDEDYRESAARIHFPLVVKTSCGGSSVGVYIVHNDDELDTAMSEVYQYGDEVLLEQYIKGREMTCGVIEGKALPVIEIEPLEGFYDYKNKYQEGSSVETCPAKISEECTRKIQKAAEKAFAVLHLQTYARIDFILDENGIPYCLEANTLPGMTPISLLPQEAQAVGMDYAALCEHIIEISLRKYR